MIYKKQQFGTFNLHTIKTDKFKLCHVEIYFRNNVNVNDITKRNALFDVLFENNNEFKSRRLLNLKLEELYNAGIYCSNSKVGNAFVTSCDIDFISPKYTEKGIVKDSIKLLFDMIFNPNVNNNEFDNKTVELVKKRIRDDINSIKESPAKQAIVGAKENLKDTPTAYTSLGSLDDIDAITPESLYEYYEKVLASDYIDIFVIGDLDMEEVTKYILQYAKFDVIKTHRVDLYTPDLSVKTKFRSAKFTSAQSNIVMLLRLNDLSDYEKKYVANLYNMILGGGFNSKFMQIIREKNSLAYYINSSVLKADNILLIQSGISKENFKKVVSNIKKIMKDITKGDITEEELETVRTEYLSLLEEVNDNIDSILENYIATNLLNLDDFSVRKEKIKEVTVQDIINVSKKVHIDTIYLLEDGGNNNA